MPLRGVHFDVVLRALSLSLHSVRILRYVFLSLAACFLYLSVLLWISQTWNAANLRIPDAQPAVPGYAP